MTLTGFERINVCLVVKMSSPREYIEEIKSRQASSDREYVLGSLSGAIDRLQEVFSRYGSFLMEFVPNTNIDPISGG